MCKFIEIYYGLGLPSIPSNLKISDLPRRQRGKMVEWSPSESKPGDRVFYVLQVRQLASMKVLINWSFSIIHTNKKWTIAQTQPYYLIVSLPEILSSIRLGVFYPHPLCKTITITLRLKDLAVIIQSDWVCAVWPTKFLPITHANKKNLSS